MEKAFDLIEYPIHLHWLCGIGINGKLWRLLKDSYCGLRGCVRLNGHKSGEFPVMRGIHQGSVLSPILFLMVMDPLLQQLEMLALGPSILNNLYVGGFLHADDIRTLASSLDVLDAQVSLVQGFTKENLLKLNIQKCEVVVFASDPHAPYPEYKIAEQSISVGSEDKCLGYLWQGNLMANMQGCVGGHQQSQKKLFSLWCNWCFSR